MDRTAEQELVTRGFSLPGWLMEKVEQTAKVEDRSCSSIVRRALIAYLDMPKADSVVVRARQKRQEK